MCGQVYRNGVQCRCKHTGGLQHTCRRHSLLPNAFENVRYEWKDQKRNWEKKQMYWKRNKLWAHKKTREKENDKKKSSLQLIRRIYMVGIRHMFHLKKYLCIVYKCSLSIRNASYVIQILLSHFIEHCSIKRHSTS